jgi:iron(III) transport system permease protein
LSDHLFIRTRIDRLKTLPWADTAPLLLAVIICTPMIIVAAGIFGSAGEEWQHIRSILLLDYVVDTVLLAVGVTMGASALGTLFAWFTVNYDYPGSRLFSWALGLPIALPAYISAYTYAHMFGITGPFYRLARFIFGAEIASIQMINIMSLPGCMFVMIFALYPYVYFTARSFFSGSSRSYIETARSCGKGDVEVFINVALPITRPAIVAGGALVLMETLNEYGATSYYGVNTMVTGIFRAWFALGDVGSATKLAGFFLMAVIGILSMERLNRRRRRYHDSAPRPFDLMRPSRPARAAMTVFSILPLAFGLFIPLAQLIAWTVQTADMAGLFALSYTLVRSTLLAGVSGAICVVVSLLFIFFVRRRRSTATLIATEALLSGYAVPGAIIVVGVLSLSRFVDRVSTVYLFGSIGLLVYAYIVRYLAITTKPLQASMAKIPTTLDDACLLSGKPKVNTFLRIHLPLMRSGVATGLLLVSIDLLKELPMTLVLRPFNFDTLATRAFELAQQDRLPESALPAVAIVLICIIPAALLARRKKLPKLLTEHKNESQAT